VEKRNAAADEFSPACLSWPECSLISNFGCAALKDGIIPFICKKSSHSRERLDFSHRSGAQPNLSSADSFINAFYNCGH
jgi:hypothetical protein